jgi:hypothetical protein
MLKRLLKNLEKFFLLIIKNIINKQTRNKMNLIFYIIFFYTKINISFGQNENYCNLGQKCSNCQICGQDTNYYCSCNFYNIYCYNDSPGNIQILSDFLLNYDGCLSGNGNMEKVCGTSNLNLDSGNNKATINFQNTYLSSFVCYYVLNNLNNKNVFISMKKEGNEVIYFNLHLVIYYSFNQINVSSKTISFGYSNDLEINELNVDKLSIYIDVKNGKNMDKISITVSIEDNTVKTVNKYYTGSYKKTKYIIYCVILGVVGLILIIILTCLIIRRRKNKRRHNPNSINNETINNSNQSSLTVYFFF